MTYQRLVFLLICLLSLSAFTNKSGSYKVLPTDEQIIYDVQYSANGEVIIVADGGNIKWFSAIDHQLLATFSGEHTSNIFTLALSSDSSMLASAGKDSAIIVWDVHTKKASKRLSHHEGVVTTVAFSADNQFLISGGADHKVIVYDLKNEKVVQTITAHQNDITSIATHPTKNIFCSADGDGKINLYSINESMPISSLSSSKHWVREVAFSEDETKIVSCGDNSKVITWSISDLKNPKKIEVTSPCRNWLFSTKISSDNATIVSGGLKGLVTVSTPFNNYFTKMKVPVNDLEFKPSSEIYLEIAIATQGKGVVIMEVKNMSSAKD